jgi:hypothetical protein
MLTPSNILLRHNFIMIPSGNSAPDQQNLVTVFMNLSYYGYALGRDAYNAVASLDNDALGVWWTSVEKELKSITGDDRNIGDFVVYKNFPAEVLDKTDAEYWLPQLLMYWGFPKEHFTEEVKPREKMMEQPKCKVLKLSNEQTLTNILQSYLASPARWKPVEQQDVLELASRIPADLSKLTFKENLVALVKAMIERGYGLNITTATDVLRLGAGLSDGDISLRENVKFKSFPKATRRMFVNMLEKCKNRSEDFARRPEMWKRFLHNLHPGDFRKQCPLTCEDMNLLYHDTLTTFNGKIEVLLKDKDPAVLDLLMSRPGEFRRRLVHTLNLFGDKAVTAFAKVAAKLTTHQIVSLRTYLETVNDRLQRVFPPKGNWNKLQIAEARHVKDEEALKLIEVLTNILKQRMPKVKFLDPNTARIKLANNGGDTGEYTRGTVFPVPKEVKFIRTASYWQNDACCWFDNGWNFFDDSWKSVGALSWTQQKYPLNSKGDKVAAAFSGDPVNSGHSKGMATQLIDLYPERLLAEGVRYAVWNVLCYSSIPFSKAKDVFAALQWGEDAQKGQLFEPSRAQLSFPLKGEQLTKYVCLLDLEKREMTYLDANLQGNVQDAARNNAILAKTMPAFMEYINALPTVHDLFRDSVDANSDLHIVYSDAETELKDNVRAYVFKPENKNNQYKTFDVNSVL